MNLRPRTKTTTLIATVTKRQTTTKSTSRKKIKKDDVDDQTKEIMDPPPAERKKKTAKKSSPTKAGVTKKDEFIALHRGNFDKTFSLIKEFRKHNLAPVDTMGCERLSEAHQPPEVDPSIVSFVVLLI
jgi:hypothetical protein